ncbi:NAD(P)H-dependent oxidoreductase [Vibrio rumoiensis]|uniref:NAD(P)H-dependent oxidoreductase n=1 Tax=Vibrio rumoiensis TaxID=76258 RepID=UPI003AA883AF
MNHKRHSLVVVAHPSPKSLTAELAKTFITVLSTLSPNHTIDLLDLYAENFDPVFSKEDFKAYNMNITRPKTC